MTGSTGRKRGEGRDVMDWTTAVVIVAAVFAVASIVTAVVPRQKR